MTAPTNTNLTVISSRASRPAAGVALRQAIGLLHPRAVVEIIDWSVFAKDPSGFGERVKKGAWWGLWDPYHPLPDLPLGVCPVGKVRDFFLADGRDLATSIRDAIHPVGRGFPKEVRGYISTSTPSDPRMLRFLTLPGSPDQVAGSRQWLEAAGPLLSAAGLAVAGWNRACRLQMTEEAHWAGSVEDYSNFVHATAALEHEPLLQAESAAKNPYFNAFFRSSSP